MPTFAVILLTMTCLVKHDFLYFVLLLRKEVLLRKKTEA